MKKVLKGMFIFIFIICISIIGNSTQASADSRSNKYLTTSLNKTTAKMTVKNDFTVESMTAYMQIGKWNYFAGSRFYYDYKYKTTKKTRRCNLSYQAGGVEIIGDVYFEGIIEGSLASAWKLYN